MAAKKTKPETKTPNPRYSLLIGYEHCPEPDIEGPFDSIAAILAELDSRGYDDDFEGFMGILTPDHTLLHLKQQYKWAIDSERKA